MGLGGRAINKKKDGHSLADKKERNKQVVGGTGLPFLAKVVY